MSEVAAESVINAAASRWILKYRIFTISVASRDSRTPPKKAPPSKRKMVRVGGRAREWGFLCLKCLKEQGVINFKPIVFRKEILEEPFPLKCAVIGVDGPF